MSVLTWIIARTVKQHASVKCGHELEGGCYVCLDLHYSKDGQAACISEMWPRAGEEAAMPALSRKAW